MAKEHIDASATHGPGAFWVVEDGVNKGLVFDPAPLKPTPETPVPQTEAQAALDNPIENPEPAVDPNPIDPNAPPPEGNE